MHGRLQSLTVDDNGYQATELLVPITYGVDQG